MMKTDQSDDPRRQSAPSGPRRRAEQAAIATLDPHAPPIEVPNAAAEKFEIMQSIVNQDSVVDTLFGEFLQMEESLFGLPNSRLRGLLSGLRRFRHQGPAIR